MAVSQVLAAQCGPLHRVNSIPITLDRGGRPLVPATIGGKPHVLVFDTAATISTVKKSIVDEFHLTVERDAVPASVNVYRDRLDRKVMIPTLVVERIRGNAWSFAVEPEGFADSDEPGNVGTLSPALLRQFDIELDFANRKLNLFSPDHCEGKVLYWQPKALAIVPIQIMNSGHIFARVTLDGKRMDALVDTGSERTILNAGAARNLFGVDERAANTARVKPAAANTSLMHDFKTLSFDGIAVPNPMIQILLEQTKAATPFNPGSMRMADEPQAPDLILGQSVLSKLHLYIAYREHKLYVTNAEPSAR